MVPTFGNGSCAIESNKYDELFQYMAEKCYIEVMQLLMSVPLSIYYVHTNQKTPFEFAVDLEDAPLLDVLLMYRGDAFQNRMTNGKTIIHYACERNSSIALDKLVQHFYDINVLDIDNRTALHYCAKFGSLNACTFLLRHCVNVNKIDVHGNTALHDAFNYKNFEICHRIGSHHKCNLELKDKMGRTVLLLACMQNNLSVVKWIIEYGADVHTTDLGNVSPFTVAHFSDINGVMYDELVKGDHIQYVWWANH